MNTLEKQTATDRACAHVPTTCPSRTNEVDILYAQLSAVDPVATPRTARLMNEGTRKISQKLIEEAAEVALDAVRYRNNSVIRESADLLYHLVVLWHALGIDPDDVWSEMRARAAKLGIAEKLPKRPGKTTIA